MKYSPTYISDIAKIWECVAGREQLAGKRMLVTGSTGLIGSALADTLLWANKNRDADMCVLAAGRSREQVVKRFETYTEGTDYFFVPYDINDVMPAVDVDYVLHIAGIANTTWYSAKPVETLLSTINSINTILQHVRDRRGVRVLYVSSSEVYGNTDGKGPHEETMYGGSDILNPRSCYSSAKQAAETLCASYCREYDTDVVIARPGHVYGPTVNSNDARASSVFPKQAAEGKQIVMKSAGMQLRSYCYVLDSISAMLTILTKGKSGEAYNISNSRSIVTIRQMAEAFAEAGGVSIRTEDATETEKAGYNMMQNSSLDAKKLEALGWKGLFDMQTGATHTIEMLRYQK